MTKLLDFPCTFPIKAFSRNAEGVEALVLEIARRHVPGLDESAVRSRPSKEGTYLAITVTIVAENMEQIEAIYRDLRAQECVLTVL